LVSPGAAAGRCKRPQRGMARHTTRRGRSWTLMDTAVSLNHARPAWLGLSRRVGVASNPHAPTGSSRKWLRNKRSAATKCRNTAPALGDKSTGELLGLPGRRRKFGLEQARVGGRPTRRRVSALLAERAAQASPRATAGLPEQHRFGARCCSPERPPKEVGLPIRLGVGDRTASPTTCGHTDALTLFAEAA